MAVDDKKKLPRGFNDHTWGWDSVWEDYTDKELKEPVKPKCTCGVTKTMGKDDHLDYHSNYCDLKRIK
jgi:hypothetical protein